MKVSAAPVLLLFVACRTPAPPPVGVAGGTSDPQASTVEAQKKMMIPSPATGAPQTVARGSLDSERFKALSRRLCVTEGEFSGAEGRVVAASKMRCVHPQSSGDQAKLVFKYQGPSKERTLLKSGASREQIGLKLRARDTCNLLYVMWRIAPTPSVVVSFKNNPDQSTHAECENNGYSNLKPTLGAPPPPITEGSEHELSAEIVNDLLTARIDGTLVWQGALPEGVQQLKGPAGFRSDNVEWTVLDFDAGASAGAGAGVEAAPLHCRNER